MRRLALLFPFLAALVGLVGFAGPAWSDGPSGSTECHLNDDDCDGAIDEDTGTATDDDDGDGLVDEDTGTAADDNDGDGLVDEDSADGLDNDGDGLIDEDPADDDGDGLVDEDPPGDAADDPGENQVDCNESTSTDVNGVQVYAGGNGVEACNDGGNADAPEGRVIATSDDGGYAAADGENSNGEPANGYFRVDGNGAHCGDATNQDSTSSQTNNTPEDCDPNAS